MDNQLIDSTVTETEEKQALIDSTLDSETYTVPTEKLQNSRPATDLIATEDLDHAILEYASENMINIGLREAAMGVGFVFFSVYVCDVLSQARENAMRARMYQRTLQTVKTKLHGVTKPTRTFRSWEPEEFFSSTLEEMTEYEKQLTMKYGLLLQDAYNEIINFTSFPSCLVKLSQEDKSVN